MPFADRLELNTVIGLFKAAGVRFREAECLRESGFLIGAIYLHGYTAEMVLGAAIVRARFDGSSDSEITPQMRDSITRDAKNRSRMGKNPVHPVDGLAYQLVADRKDRSERLSLKRSEREGEVDRLLRAHAKAFGANWRPVLRYQSVEPTEDEVEEIRIAAEWLLAHQHEL